MFSEGGLCNTCASSGGGGISGSGVPENDGVVPGGERPGEGGGGVSGSSVGGGGENRCMDGDFPGIAEGLLGPEPDGIFLMVPGGGRRRGCCAAMGGGRVATTSASSGCTGGGALASNESNKRNDDDLRRPSAVSATSGGGNGAGIILFLRDFISILCRIKDFS